MRFEHTTLHGRYIRLEPLRTSHIDGLALAVKDGRLWDIPETMVPHPDDLADFVEHAMKQRLLKNEMAFAIVDRGTERVTGSTRFGRIDPVNLKVEIGSTFVAGSMQRTYTNTEAKYLLLQHAFERWLFNRVEFVADILNTKSRRAIERIGAKQEGILRSHMIMRKGRVRDSAIYSILRTEWGPVKRRLEARLRTAPEPTR
jgi:RimJ/RimL family protein N-acetyltransferase